MTIRQRIMWLSTAGVFVLVLALGQFYRLSRANSELTRERRLAGETHLAVQRIDLLAYEYLLYGEPRSSQQLTLQCSRLEQETRAFGISNNLHQQVIALELQRTTALLTALTIQRQAPVGVFIPSPVRSRFLAEQLIISSHEMFDHTRRWQTETITSRDALLCEATASAVIASSVILLLLIAGALLLLRTIVLPVERLRRAVMAVAAGDLTQRLLVDRADELGALTVGFNQMTSALVIAAQERERTVELTSRSAALERINRELEHFAALASHDLQAPLRTASNFVELIQRRAHDQLDEASRHHLQRITDATKRMRALIENLLRFARAGSVAMDQDINLCCRNALDQALENLALPISEAGASLEIGELPEVRFDGIQLIQVFQNLIGNALKYRDPARALQIRIWSRPGPPGYHALAIADNGPGIAEEHHENIFGMFKRAHTQEISGSGIGLALCRKVIRHRGGEIDVESLPGHGATFHFLVPVGSRIIARQCSSRRLSLVP